MADLLPPSQLDGLLQLLASPRPFHLLSESFHSSFDRTVRYKAVLATLHLLYEADDDPTRRLPSPEEKKEDTLKASPQPPLPLAPHPSPSSLLSFSAVLRPSQRLAALFLLYDFSRPDSPPDAPLTAALAQSLLLRNPFLPHLLHHVDCLDPPPPPSSTLAAERQLTVRLLLHQQLSTVRQRSARDFLDQYKPDRYSSQPSFAPPASASPSSSHPPSELASMLQPLRAYVHARLPPPAPSLTAYLALCSRGPLPPSAPSTPRSERSAASSVSPALSLVDEGARSGSPSPSPSSHLNPLPLPSHPLPFDLLVDCLQRAARGHLPSGERHAVVAALGRGGGGLKVEALVGERGVGPAQLPALIEKNPAVAVALLQAVLTPPVDAELAGAMLQPLLQAELSLHSMEVVNRLATATAGGEAALLPGEFLVGYLHHALECCRGIKDRYAQGRMVRLVCVFLQSLLREERRGGLGEGLDLLSSELMSFCVDFSKVKEAAALFRMLKEWEAS